MANPGRLVISRTEDKDIKMRGLVIYLDGEYLTDLYYGQTHSVDVEPGDHKVKFTNHLYSKTLDIPVVPGEEVTIAARNQFGLIGGFFMSVIGFGTYKVYAKELSRTAP